MEPNTSMTFKNVKGVDEVKKYFIEVVEFPKKLERLTIVKAYIPKGVILVGPLGTRNTLLAKEITGEAIIPFFSILEFSFVEIFIGIREYRVCDLFKKEKENIPFIMFVDEIDTVGRQRGTSISGTND
eukprot:Gb_11666 [translate_table: standard]